MSDQRTIELTDLDLERVWQLTAALIQADNSQKRSMDLLFITAARFVERVSAGLSAEGVVLDSGKGGPQGPLTYRVCRRP